MKKQKLLMKHGIAIDKLSDRLESIEKTVASHGEEMKEFDRRISRAEMMKPFVDLAERFLTKFEQMMETATKDNVYLRFKADLSRREQELIKEENELRLQMARCRRRVNSMMRALARREEVAVSVKDAGFEAAASVVGYAPAADVSDAITGSSAAKTPHDNSLKLLYLIDKTAGEDIVGQGGEQLICKGERICMATAEKIYDQGLTEQLVKSMI
jgi:hypothetical protein